MRPPRHDFFPPPEPGAASHAPEASAGNAREGPPTAEHVVRGADDTPLFVRTGGLDSGPAILFLHGYLYSSDVFARQFHGDLARRFRLVAPDLRGHGRSGQPAAADAYLDARRWADDVARVVEELQLQRPIVVGWSMGARVALSYGWYHGFDQIAGLNLVSAVVTGLDRGSQSSLPPELANLLAADDDTRVRATRGFVRACAGTSTLSRELENAFVDTAMRTAVTARRASRLWPLHYADSLTVLRTPVLVTHGVDDQLVPVASSRELASLLPMGRLSVIGGGHLPFLLDPQTFDAELTTFADTALG